MPNTFAPFGFGIYDYEGGKANFTMRSMPLAASGAGDGVSLSFGQGDAMGLTTAIGYSGLSNSFAAGGSGGLSADTDNYIMGVFTQVSYTTPQGQAVPGTGGPGFYWPANTPTFNSILPIVKLNHLPNTVYEIQCNGPLPSQGAYGVNYGIVENGAVYNANNGNQGIPNPGDTSVAANPASGQSQQFLNVLNGATGGVNTTNGTCKIIGLAPTSSKFPTNNWTDPFPIVLVKINLHFLSAPTVSTL